MISSTKKQFQDQEIIMDVIIAHLQINLRTDLLKTIKIYALLV